jgi:hypothetical protein
VTDRAIITNNNTEAASTAARIATFDYTQLAPSLADALRNQAARIRERVQSTNAAIIEIGRDLIAVKQYRLDHGQFVRWVELQCGLNKRTAQLYMQVAEFIEGKSETVSLLQMKTLYEISRKGAPSEIVAADTAGPSSKSMRCSWAKSSTS